jgi:hypothetical protein
MKTNILIGIAALVIAIAVTHALVTAALTPRQCADVQIEVLAFEQCITKGYACSVDGPKAFNRHYRNKQWMRLNSCAFIK